MTQRTTQTAVSERHGNRTGIVHASGAREMIDASQRTEPTPGDAGSLREAEQEYGKDAPSLGSAPENGDPTAEHLEKLLDKLGERLAFERTGTRLYEGILRKHEARGGFAGGPEREELERFRDEEARHFALLVRVVQDLGGDPTAVTPSADLAGVEATGIAKAIGDPRTTLPQALHALLAAELVDGAGWELLIELTREVGIDGVADSFEIALEEEQRHLESVRQWIQADALGEAG